MKTDHTTGISNAPEVEAKDVNPLGAVLDELEAKAKAATKGAWLPIASPNEGQASAVVDENFDVIFYVGVKNRPNAANAAYLAELDPDTCLALIEVARAALLIAQGAWSDSDGWSSVDTELIEALERAVARLGTERRPQ